MKTLERYGIQHSASGRGRLRYRYRSGHGGAPNGGLRPSLRIDVEQKFVEKLDLEEFRQYRILGACNPPLARKGLDEELDLGVLLPCNVVVSEADDGTIVVSTVDPNALLSIVEEPALDQIANDVRERFERVLGTLSETAETTT